MINPKANFKKIYLGLDVSSASTGWCVVEVGNEKRLVEYGLIRPEGGMGVTQRLYFFGNELKKVIDKYQPNEIAMEETILVRGPKIMRVLSRFSGVAIYLAYSYQKRELALYEPPAWKKSLGLSGHAKKPEIQLKVCEAFRLIDGEKVKDYQKQLDQCEEDLKNVKSNQCKITKTMELEVNEARKQFEKYKKDLKKKKKNERTEEDDKLLENMENDLKTKIKTYKEQKKESNGATKEVEKKYEKVSLDIYSDSGINSDIADSCGIILCQLNKIENENKISK